MGRRPAYGNLPREFAPGGVNTGGVRVGAEKVTIDYDLLTDVRDSITQIIAELEDAPERNADVAGAIGAPFEHGRLSMAG